MVGSPTEQEELISAVASANSTLPILINFDSTISTDQIDNFIAKLKAKHKGVIFINATELTETVLTPREIKPFDTNATIIVQNRKAQSASEGPTFNDTHLRADVWYEGQNASTSMAFLGPNDILVLEKNTGKVSRIVNGKMLPEPLIDVNVANQAERGLLGIAIANYNKNNSSIDGNTHYSWYY